jgi:hypothetical protein
MNKGIKISIYLPEDEARSLKETSEATGTSISRLIRGAWRVALHYDGVAVPGTIFPLPQDLLQRIRKL